MNDVIRCNACGAGLSDTFVATCPACCADLAAAGLYRVRVGSAVRRAVLALVGVVVLLVVPKVIRWWAGL